MQVYQNISLAQINIVAGQEEYYLPKNANWNGEKIERIALVFPSGSMQSPIDGQQVLSQAQLPDMYIDLYAADDTEICHSLHYTNILNTNNHPFEIGQVLSLSLSRIFFSVAPQTSGAMLLYIFYNRKNTLEVESSENISIRFPLQAGERLNFTDLINKYMHANDKNVKRIICWDPSAPAFLTLRDTTGKLAFTELSTNLFRAPINGGSAQTSQVYPLSLDNVDLDFDNCWIHNTTAANQQHVITFEY